MKFIEWPPPRYHPFPASFDYEWAREHTWIWARLEPDYAVEEILDPMMLLM